ncbi:MAG TPA: UvrD-helicase domain-containing protein [Vicinamibacterales bacterium]|nr:UvrD-helicase domain-containing protein [Vicinamibacterales bacterium]
MLAGAGSGKTRVIAHRVAHLVRERHAALDEVLAVTFTNKAAEEMRERVGRLIEADCRPMWISTFHSLCARLLRREAHHLGLSRSFTIYDVGDQQAVIKQLVKEYQLDDTAYQPRMVLSRISHAKNRMEGPETFTDGWNPKDREIGRLYAGYLKALTDASALDFDDLLLKAVELFEKAPEVRRRYAHRLKFAMIDEYQDTNRPQYLLVKQLVSVHGNLCVVGDPDQSIYKWRGADVKNILDFKRDFPEAVTVKLERNYRSTQVILDAASAVVSHNSGREDKRLWTDQAGGAPIVTFRGADELDEADFIVKVVRKALQEDYDTTAAILYRTNAQSRAVEDGLRMAGITYAVLGGTGFYERKEIKDALSYLKLVLNPHDDVAIRRVINVPPRGIGKGVMDALERVDASVTDDRAAPLLAGLEQIAATNTLWAKIDHAVTRGTLAARQSASLAAFRDMLLGIIAAAQTEPVSTILGLLLDRSGYLRDLREERSEEADGRIENLMELVSVARQFETAGLEAGLAEFVDRLALLSDVDKPEGSRNAQALLMTMHSAKGLEFPVVVIAGLEEGLFPHSRARESEEELEEERRLCYVGITRARKELYLTSAMRRRVFGEYKDTEPSRFLDEIPPQLVKQEESRAGAMRTSSARGWGYAPNPYRRAPDQTARAARTYAPEDEDQSGRGGLRSGSKVRHAMFGTGTVLSVEELDDDLKLVVKFTTVGTKTLRAKYAKLELV